MKKIFRSFFDVHFCFPTLEKASPPLVVSLDQLHVPPLLLNGLQQISVVLIYITVLDASNL